MIRKIVNWFNSFFKERKRKKEYNKRLEEIRKRDPFIYKH